MPISEYGQAVLARKARALQRPLLCLVDDVGHADPQGHFGPALPGTATGKVLPQCLVTVFAWVSGLPSSSRVGGSAAWWRLPKSVIRGTACIPGGAVCISASLA